MGPLALAVLLAAPAWPCGGLFHDPGELAHSDTQVAHFDRRTAGVTTVSYAVSYEGDATSFGWVIPIPGEFQALEDGDLDALLGLLYATDPIIFQEQVSHGWGCGYGADGSKGGGMDTGSDTGGAGEPNGVTVVTSGMSATYAYTVLEATSEDALLGWLAENGWDVGESGPSVAEYVADGGWQWVAIGLVPDGSPAGMLPPVSVTYAGEDVVYPARMSRYAMVDEVHTVVLVEGDTPTRVSTGWSVAEVGELAGELGADASALFADRLRALGGGSPGYGLVYSDELGSSWVTRFDALTLKEANTADAVFAPSEDDTPVRATITLSEAGDETNEALLVFAPLLAIGWTLRRRG